MSTPTSPTESHRSRGDREVRISIDPESSRFRDDADARSSGSERRGAFRRKRTMTAASSSYQNPSKIVGAEPGIEATQEVDLDLYADCGITVVDFGEEEVRLGGME